jgi:hypothetical protein
MGGSNNGIIVILLEAAGTQANVAKNFFSDARFRDPVLIIWVASFGSALHAPVTTYYLLEVGIVENPSLVLSFTLSHDHFCQFF